MKLISRIIHLEFRDLCTTLIFHFTPGGSSTLWRQILPRRIATRASCSSELLHRSLSDPKRLLMSQRSESDKLLRPRITARANIFPENAGRSLCSRDSSPPPPSPPSRPHFSRFSVMRADADEIGERERGKGLPMAAPSRGESVCSFLFTRNTRPCKPTC